MNRELAEIIERDRASKADDCESCHEYAAAPAEADRRALLGLLRECRAALLREIDAARFTGDEGSAESYVLLARLAVLEGREPA